MIEPLARSPPPGGQPLGMFPSSASTATAIASRLFWEGSSPTGSWESTAPSCTSPSSIAPGTLVWRSFPNLAPGFTPVVGQNSIHGGSTDEVPDRRRRGRTLLDVTRRYNRGGERRKSHPRARALTARATRTAMPGSVPRRRSYRLRAAGYCRFPRPWKPSRVSKHGRLLPGRLFSGTKRLGRGRRRGAHHRRRKPLGS